MYAANRLKVFLAAVALISLAAGVDPLSALQKKGRVKIPPLVDLEVQAPVGRADDVSTQVASGWPLTLRLSGNREIGIGRSSTPPIFPVSGSVGFLVFADPDGCRSWASKCPETDETYVEFIPGETLPPLTYENNPTIKTFGGQTNNYDEPVGPPTGPAWWGGYGFGRSVRLPGLVILADTGVGVVFEEDFDRVLPRKARNLAGFISSVSYELNDATSRTNIVAHMIVPRSLFEPIILADRSIGACPGQPWAETWARVDGGGIVKVTPGLNTLESLVEGQVITIRAFVVNRNAPDEITDMNGDGIVSDEDAELAGYELLAGEEVIRIKRYYQPIELFGYPYDLDGNKCVGGVVAPTGAGDITRVPR